MTTRDWEFFARDGAATEAFGAALARCAPEPFTLYLRGDLGAGKTTVVRGFLHGLGHRGAVKSPTYTLVEPYEPDGRCVFHFDLYRLTDPEELEYMGVRDYFAGDAVCLVEWPERGAGTLPPADLELDIAYHDLGRALGLRAGGAVGERIVACLQERKILFS